MMDDAKTTEEGKSCSTDGMKSCSLKNCSFKDMKVKSEQKIKELWEGQISLFEAFWVYFFAVVAGLQILSFPMGFLGDLLRIATFGWAAFMVKPVWMAAGKYTGEKHWAMLAKIATGLLVLLSFVSLLG